LDELNLYMSLRVGVKTYPKLIYNISTQDVWRIAYSSPTWHRHE